MLETTKSQAGRSSPTGEAGMGCILLLLSGCAQSTFRFFGAYAIQLDEGKLPRKLCKLAARAPFTAQFYIGGEKVPTALGDYAMIDTVSQTDDLEVCEFNWSDTTNL